MIPLVIANIIAGAALGGVMWASEVSVAQALVMSVSYMAGFVALAIGRYFL